MPLLYAAPLNDMRFCLEVHGGLHELLALPVNNSLDEELLGSVLNEAAKFAQAVLSPLNAQGDREKVQLENGKVTMPKGFADAYRMFVQAGWNAAPSSLENGGQGLLQPVCTLIAEMWHGANMAFGLAPMLTQSAVELIAHHAAPDLKARFLPKLISGEWTGSMCMTEAQAGSDIGAVATRAEEDTVEKEVYRIRGTKIFITYGEHDLAPNIVHLVLARLPGAPEGSKGLSLFLVPKVWVDAQAKLGEPNDVACASIEEKMGIHASPTCVMSFGEKEGAKGYLVGKKHGGIVAMFTMMNQARLAVGLQGVGIMEYARQLADAYARERVQGRRPGTPQENSVSIAHHPDVARMLSTIAAHAQAGRALSVFTAYHQEMAEHSENAGVHRAMVDLLTPIVKAHLTDVAFQVTSLAMQIFGGAGYIEESGVAQLMRDVRIAMIYEGTNGIQALDLMERKLVHCRDALDHLFKDMDGWTAALRAYDQPAADLFDESMERLRASTTLLTDWQSDAAFAPTQRERAQEMASAYLTQFGTTLEMAMLVKAAIYAYKHTEQAGGYSQQFLQQKIAALHHFAIHALPQASAMHLALRHRALLAS